MSKEKNPNNNIHSPDCGHTDQVETWDIARLRHNPRQDENFHPMSDDELERLSKSIRVNGQRDPIEVLPPRVKKLKILRAKAIREFGYPDA